MSMLTTAEKVEAIVLCHLGKYSQWGELGSLQPMSDGSYEVKADGLTVAVTTCRRGWSVTLGAITAEGYRLYETIRDVLKISSMEELTVDVA